MSSESEMRNDRTDIREIVGQYFAALDLRDPKLMAGCFSEDTVYKALDGEGGVYNGIADTVAVLMGVKVFTATNHKASNVTINLKGDSADVVTFAIAHCLIGPIDSARILIRGLRYVDKFKRTPAGWRIAHRRHIPLWQYETASVPLALPQS